MNNSFEMMSRLEKLLETLIKMTGKTNERVDDVNKRLTQMEFIVRKLTRLDKSTSAPQRLFSYILEPTKQKHIANSKINVK